MKLEDYSGLEELSQSEANEINGGKSPFYYIGYSIGYIANLDWTNTAAGD